MKKSGEQDSEWPDPVDWIEENFWIPELKGPIVLMPYQRDALREALSRDENGDFNYSTVIWSDIKKSAKSSIAAAVIKWFALHTEWGEIFMVANDMKQADTRVAHYLRRSFELNPAFKDAYRLRHNRMTIKETRTIVEPVPIDPSGEAGTNADFIQFSELWGAHEEAKTRMFSEMSLSPTKQGRSIRWIESYAGFREQSLLLWSLYERGVLNGEQLWPDRLYETNFEGQHPLELFREGRMLCMWNTKARCPWQERAYYDEEEKNLPDAQFRRLHKNEWVSAIDTFVPIEWWDACTDNNMPMPTEKTSFVIALDAGVSNDPFAMVMVYRHPEIPEDTCIHWTRRWLPPKGGKLDFLGTEKDPGPELTLLGHITNNRVVCVPYDEYQLHDMATRFKRKRLVWMYAFSQMGDRLKADSQLRDMIRDRRIHHNGTHEHLRKNIMNAMAQITSEDKEDRKIRIVKASKEKKVDLTVALSMANYQCVKLNL